MPHFIFNGSKIILIIAVFIITSCGSKSTSNPPKTPTDKPGDHGTPPTNPPASEPSQATIYGTWEGSGKLYDEVRYNDHIKFKHKNIHFERKCDFPGGNSISISADGATLDNETGTSLTLIGSLFMTAELDGNKCFIDLPASLNFVLVENFIFIRLQDAEKKTGLRKISNE